MEYSRVAEAYEKMEKTRKRLELIDILTKLLVDTPTEMIEKIVYLTQGKIKPDFYGIELGMSDKLVIRALEKTTSMSSNEIQEQYNKIGDLGEVTKMALEKKAQTTLIKQELTVERVHKTFEDIATTTGQGSIEMKLAKLSGLLSDCSPIEGKYIIRTFTGILRLGIADYTVLDALSIAFTNDKANRKYLEKAYNISGDLGKVAKTVAQEGLDELNKIKITVGNPIRPMLAERLSSADEIIKKIEGKVGIEYKLDGERLQIHLNKQVVKIFSRSLENITAHYPDVERIMKKLKIENMIIEAEAVAIDNKSNNFLPFQELMHRRRKHRIEEAVKNYPISINLFDILYLNDKDLTDHTYKKRREILENITKKSKDLNIIKQTITDNPEKINNFLEKSIEEGCEGLVIKDLNGTYRAGAREYLWIKLKKEYNTEMSDTLDLVVIGGIYGKGKRVNTYGALLLASYDKESNKFRSFCKVGTGFTDENLRLIYDKLQKNKINEKYITIDSKMQADVWFKPNLVIEISGTEITLSPIHTSNKNEIRKNFGLALRFPIFTGRIREDKLPQDVTTTMEIRKLYEKQLKKVLK
ncbi:MAG: ATP-dependent DNA ligase [Thaumarchaeota archaeon]|nr:ATP-dependent DNA ligase [Nitrososphaerota archaeon]